MLLVSLSNLAYNFKILQELCFPSTIGAVVKANAYGLGIEFVVPTLDSVGCRHFFVNTLAEGVAVRCFTNADIYIFDAAMPWEDMSDYNTHNLTPIFSSFNSVMLFKNVTNIAVRLDTGFGLAGINASDETKLLNALKNKNVTLLLSHLSDSENAQSSKNKQQLELFNKIASYFPNALKSLSASYGVALGKEYLFDIIRSGASLVGASVLENSKNVATLKTKVGYLQHFEKGVAIGYNGSIILEKDTLVATLLIGSNDGIVHQKGCFVDYKGTLLPVLGKPTTNYLAVDACATYDIKIGDDVNLFSDFYTPEMLAKNAGLDVGADVLIRLNTCLKRKAV